jgi:DNA-binding transcriptional regulator LsrR (DeoR family)
VQDPESSLATRAAWLAYVGGYTQEQIAERLGVSRVKAHRLIASALQSGRVKVFVEGEPAECIALEDQLIHRFALRMCTVVPALHDIAANEPDSNFAALGVAGARFLYRYLEKSGPTMIGIGHGRTLAAVVDRLPRIPTPDLRFVSLIGSLTRKSAANPFDVISRLAERTGGEGYFMPVPFIADSVADAEVLRAQKGVQHVLGLAKQCHLCVVGIGNIGADAHLKQTGMITASEHKKLQSLGAVGEVIGQFLDVHGSLLDCEMNQRAPGLHLDALRNREVLAIAGGRSKVDAIRAVLKSGFITGLIVDEATAQQMVVSEEKAGVLQASLVQRKRRS